MENAGTGGRNDFSGLEQPTTNIPAKGNIELLYIYIYVCSVYLCITGMRTYE